MNEFATHIIVKATGIVALVFVHLFTRIKWLVDGICMGLIMSIIGLISPRKANEVMKDVASKIIDE